MAAIEYLYLLTSLALAVYGLHSLFLLAHFLRGRGRSPAQPPDPLRWPRVTIQLPVYNEIHTVERVMRAAARLDYPAECLTIQVLDDSTDATSALIARVADDLRRHGVTIHHVRRVDRSGFKAGALKAGLRLDRSELLAVFDADFVPPPDFLRRVVPHFANARVGCVQARWTHLNRGYSLLTKAQALGVDGHFAVEQAARSAGGLWLNFNGTAGVWRRAAIVGAGGWQGDTLTEDLDLSYRAQLMGWQIVYLPDVAVPAELPVQMEAFKRQQARWAKGSMQTARKLLWPLWSAALPLRVKVAGTLHLTGYLVHPLMLSAALLALPMALLHSPALHFVPYLFAAGVGPPLLYLAAGTPEGPAWRERLRLLPWLLILGIGLSLNNTCAALVGLFGRGPGHFVRTPKFALSHEGGPVHWQVSRYAIPRHEAAWGEAALAGLTLAGMVVLAGLGRWAVIPWMLVYLCGYAYIAGVTAWQATQLRLAATPPEVEPRPTPSNIQST